jgi:hypothetical protein
MLEWNALARTVPCSPSQPCSLLLGVSVVVVAGAGDSLGLSGVAAYRKRGGAALAVTFGRGGLHVLERDDALRDVTEAGVSLLDALVIIRGLGVIA